MTLTVTTTANSPYFFVLPQQDGRIVFHYGVLGPLPKDQDPKQPTVLPPYQVTVTNQNGTIILDVPHHWWNGRWTLYEQPAAVVRSPADLVAAKRMFPYGNTGIPVPAQKATPPYAIMGSSNITVYMPTTGERQDIGLITDNSAHYMLGNDPSGMIQWALCGNTCPAHLRDQNTGKPLDLIKYYSANSYDRAGLQGSPWLARGPLNSAGNTTFDGGWVPQQAHYCEMSYVAYQATLNPSFLQDLQHSANFTVLCDAATSKVQKKPTLHGEYRGVAWALRNLFMAHAATMDAEAAGTLPDDCMPSSYWKALLDIQLAYFSGAMSDPANQTFRLLFPANPMGPWQVDYMLSVLSFAVLTGHADWEPLYLFALGNAIARTNNISGYPPGWGGAYYLIPQGTWYQAWRAGAPAAGSPPPTPAQIAQLKADPLNGGVAITGNEYLMTTRAVLVMADHLDKLGLAKVRAAYPELDSCIQICTTMNKAHGKMNARQSVVSATPIPPVQGILSILE